MNAFKIVKNLVIVSLGLAVIAVPSNLRSQETTEDSSPALIAHWPLKGNAKDVVGLHHGIAHNVTFGEGPDGAARSAAVLNGRNSMIEVPDAEPLHPVAAKASNARHVGIGPDHRLRDLPLDLRARPRSHGPHLSSHERTLEMGATHRAPRSGKRCDL